MIPPFNPSGVLPPYVGKDATVRALVSSYDVTASELVGRFATSPERVAVLTGLLTYRAQLHAIGIVRGYQWLDGSFVEDVETLEGRPPGDVDVVTFASRPMGATDALAWAAFFQAHINCFNPKFLKANLKCEAYYVDLDRRPDLIVSDTQYWCGLFSHRRTGLWKGMLRLPLASDDMLAGSQLTGATL